MQTRLVGLLAHEQQAAGAARHRAVERAQLRAALAHLHAAALGGEGRGASAGRAAAGSARPPGCERFGARARRAAWHAHLHQRAVADARAIVQDQGGEVATQLRGASRGRRGAAEQAWRERGAAAGRPWQQQSDALVPISRREGGRGPRPASRASVQRAAASGDIRARLGHRHQALVPHARAAQQAEAAKAAAVVRHRPQACAQGGRGGAGRGARPPSTPARPRPRAAAAARSWQQAQAQLLSTAGVCGTTPRASTHPHR